MNNRKNSLAAFGAWLVLLVATAPAQAADAGAISGRVSNSALRTYLENAEVRIEGTTAVAITNHEGAFTLGSVPVGAHTVLARYAGLDDQRLSVPCAVARPARSRSR